MKNASIAVALLIGSGAAAAADLGELGKPTFAVPVVVGGESKCGSQAISAVRSPDNRVLSILRQAKSTNDTEFLAVGPGFATKSRASCIIDVRLERRLEAPRTLSVDFRGAEMKDAGATATLIITLGSQRHVLQYSRGRVLDGAPGTELKRFHLVNLPKGTRQVRISVSGTAASLVKTDSALIGFEALDLCFVDPDKPEYCGAAGQPNPRAAP